MRIEQAHLRHVRMRLKVPFRTSFGEEWEREEREKRRKFMRQAREVSRQDRKLIETNDERQVRLGWNLINLLWFNTNLDLIFS